MAKLKKLVKSFLPKRKSANSAANPDNLGQPAKNIKVEDVATEVCDSVSQTLCPSATLTATASPECKEWVRLNKQSLSSLDKSIIIQGMWL